LRSGDGTIVACAFPVALSRSRAPRSWWRSAPIGVALLTLDLNQFVNPVLARLKGVTGREITVGGHVGLRIGLRPRIVADDVRMANAPWGKAPYFITAKRLRCRSRAAAAAEPGLRAHPPQRRRAP
jgi:hypothetical protein